MGANCCGKRDKNEGGLESLGQLSTGQIAHAIEYINKFFNVHAESNVIVLTFSKDQLKNFVGSLSKIMSVIKAKTQKFFLPVVVQANPMKEEEEMLVVLKSSDRIDKYELDGWFV